MSSNDHLRAPPAFQQYASDLLANENYRLMTLGERGLLDSLRNQCWVSGSIPEDSALLSRLIGAEADEIERNMTARVRSFFEPSSSGIRRLVCPELLKYRELIQERHAERVRAGRKGAKAKWGKDKRGMAEPLAEPTSRDMANAEKSRTELSREEVNRKASSGNSSSTALNLDNQAWVNDYEKPTTSSAQEYRKASRG